MLQKSRELILSLVAIVFIGVTYISVSFIFQAYPDPASLFGHALGIFGFLLMVMTEVLYTLRKRSHNARWGKMSDWLEFHIFTGLVGPFMVVLHASWRFNGLAGIVTWMTVVIVISGFIGRYIYTAVPRTPSGVELTLEDLENQVTQVESSLAVLVAPGQPDQAAATEPEIRPKSGAWLVFGRFWYDFQAALADRRPWRNLTGANRARAHQLVYLKQKRDQIRRQISSLNYARRMLSIWHLVHIPLGLTLFALAVLHIVAAIYYSVLMH
jgi:hypothetical protein